MPATVNRSSHLKPENTQGSVCVCVAEGGGVGYKVEPEIDSQAVGSLKNVGF